MKVPPQLTGKEVDLNLHRVFLKHADHNPPNLKAYWLAIYRTERCPCGCGRQFSKELWLSLS